MKQENNKEFNAAYDLIHQNSIKIPDKIAFIDDDQTINYSCLLYTSPSPRDLSTSRMPSSA